MKLRGARILIEALAAEGVELVFGYPGASVLSVYEELFNSPIRHILAAHEQGACFAAEGYARAKGRAGVVLTTSGPGATNLVTGIADAFMDSVPLVAITGNVPLEKLGHDSFQEVDIFDMTMPVTKYGIIVKRAQDIAPAVRKAFSIAQSGRKGPVLIDVPSNVFDEFADCDGALSESDEQPFARENEFSRAKYETSQTSSAEQKETARRVVSNAETDDPTASTSPILLAAQPSAAAQPNTAASRANCTASAAFDTHCASGFKDNIIFPTLPSVSICGSDASSTHGVSCGSENGQCLPAQNYVSKLFANPRATHKNGSGESETFENIFALNDDSLFAAAKLINNASRPVIYAGGGVRASGAAKQLADFSARICAPVALSYMSLGCFNPDDPDYLGILSDENKVAVDALKECDLLITLGARFNSRFSAFNIIKKRRLPLLQIDIDRAEIDKNYTASLGIVGDVKETLFELLPLLREGRGDNFASKSFNAFAPTENRGIQIIRALSDIFKDKATLVTDVGLHQVWAAHNFKIYSPELFMTSGGLGAMGFGLGAAIGAQLASNRPSLLITGDGSFNMNFNELTTAIKNHIPVIIVVMNNKSLGMIRKLQLARGRQTPASSLYLDTDYVRLAQALGARGARISESDEILPSLHNALNGTLPVVIDCEIGINTGI